MHRTSTATKLLSRLPLAALLLATCANAFLKWGRIDAAGLIKIANTPKSEYKAD